MYVTGTPQHRVERLTSFNEWKTGGSNISPVKNNDLDAAEGTNTPMSRLEMHEVGLYWSGRVCGLTPDESRELWSTWPFYPTEEEVITWYDHLTHTEALAEIERLVHDSPYYDRETDRIVPPHLERTYIDRRFN